MFIVDDDKLNRYFNGDPWRSHHHVSTLRPSRIMDFTIVILDEYVSCYPDIDWIDWKDHLSGQMASQGDNWSMTTLSGSDVWECLDGNKIERLHVVQWKPAEDTMYRVSFPDRSR